ncbi:MAG: HAD hydrolase-like protein [Chloroflexi bacterium]|nr:HAD hydrolase-like protein [Chloroflexota bacterium]
MKGLFVKSHFHNIDAILFDLDGTLTDPRLGITNCVRYAMMKMKRPLSPTTNLDWCIGPPIQDNFAHLLQTDDNALINQGIAFYRDRFQEIGLFENEVYAGIPETLTELKNRRFRLFVATSKPKVYDKQIVAHFQLDPFFEKVYGSELNGRFSQKTDLVRHILQTEQLTPTHVTMIGDRKHDIIGGKNNNTHTIGVTYGYGTLPELQSTNPTTIINAPTQLLSHFSNQ